MRTTVAAFLAVTWLLTAAVPADARWHLRGRGGQCTNCGTAPSACTSCGPSTHGTPSCSSCGTNGSSRPVVEEVAVDALVPAVSANLNAPASRELTAQTSETSSSKDNSADLGTPIPTGKPQGLTYAKVDGKDLDNLLLDPGSDSVDARVPSTTNPRGIFGRALINAQGKACVMQNKVCKELDPKDEMQAKTIKELKQWILAQDKLAEKEPFATFVGKQEKPAKGEAEKTNVAQTPKATDAQSAEAKTAKETVPAPRLSEEFAQAAKQMHSMNQRASAAENALSQIANPTAPAARVATAIFPKTSALLSPVAAMLKPAAEAMKTESATQAQALEEGVKVAATNEALADIKRIEQGEFAEMPSKAQAKAKELISLLEAGKPSDLTRAVESLLTGDENYPLNDVDPFFGDSYDKIGDKTRVAIAYTESRKLTRAALLDSVSARLKQSSDPRAQALARAIESTKVENARAYDAAIEIIGKEKRDKAICFTCGEHDSDYGFYEKMGLAAANALKQNGFWDGENKSGWFNGQFGRTSTGQTVLVNLTPQGEIFAHTTADVGTERNPLSTDPGLTAAVKEYYAGQLRKIHAENGGQWPSNWTGPQRQAVASLMGAKPSPRTPASNLVASSKPTKPSVIPASNGVEPVASQPMAVRSRLVHELETSYFAGGDPATGQKGSRSRIQHLIDRISGMSEERALRVLEWARNNNRYRNGCIGCKMAIHSNEWPQ